MISSELWGWCWWWSCSLCCPCPSAPGWPSSASTWSWRRRSGRGKQRLKWTYYTFIKQLNKIESNLLSALKFNFLYLIHNRCLTFLLAVGQRCIYTQYIDTKIFCSTFSFRTSPFHAFIPKTHPYHVTWV